ncbi:MAG: adenylate/guanylate cyclase domain-containing protein [Pirellulaceae bacterium]
MTILFCDIRGFSEISKRVGPKQTIEWINDVFTELSQSVIDTDGVLVDYIGDELMAMWGAPAEQPDHALRACLAAADMLRYIEPLREKWKEVLSDGFGFGIGINTGIAQVGNTGSKARFKYGPLGNTVNIASRVQGMTKRFDVPILLTRETMQHVRKSGASAAGVLLQLRHLADAKPVGIDEVVTLYELKSNADTRWQTMRSNYEQALACYHDSDLPGAARILASLVHDHPEDTPSVLLLGRVVEALTSKQKKIDPVVVFNQK